MRVRQQQIPFMYLNKDIFVGTILHFYISIKMRVRKFEILCFSENIKFLPSRKYLLIKFNNRGRRGIYGIEEMGCFHCNTKIQIIGLFVYQNVGSGNGRSVPTLLEIQH